MNEVTEGMAIFCADGIRHGTVAELDREYIRTAPEPDGHHHFIPLDTVAHVDEAVHLRLSHAELIAIL